MALLKLKDKSRFHMLAATGITMVAVGRVQKHLQLCHSSARGIVCGKQKGDQKLRKKIRTKH